jgi:hypothetical protein
MVVNTMQHSVGSSSIVSGVFGRVTDGHSSGLS